MSKYFFFSQTLKTAAAKKICNALMAEPRWLDVLAGSTGVIVDENMHRFKNLLPTDFPKIDTLEIASLEFGAKFDSNPTAARKPRPALGADCLMPQGMGERSFSLRVQTGELKGIAISWEQDNTLSRQAMHAAHYPGLANLASVEEITVSVNLHSPLPDDEKLFAEYADLYQQELRQLNLVLDILELPFIPFDAFHDCYNNHSDDIDLHEGSLHCSLRYKDASKFAGPYLRYNYTFDSLKLNCWGNVINTMQEWLINQGAAYTLRSLVIYGNANWFHGYPQCVTLEALDLLLREAASPQYDSYYVSYMTLEPESWEVREKRRKKVTEPRFMQLGTCELENGCKLTLRLKMLKEGYVVYLHFPSEDDMIRFAETDIYRMTKWENSVE